MNGPLHEALEHEHREIDEVLERCVGGAAIDEDHKSALQRAVDELRRHIYVEEELLFPPLRQAGLMGPVMVMLREHGQMWPLLASLEEQLAGDTEDTEEPVVRYTCRQLLVQLQHHNPKEEQILYPQVDQILEAGASHEVRELLDSGEMPAGWTCHFLRRR